MDRSWSLAPEAIELLERLVGEVQPRHILEFGSGTSTAALAAACASLPHSVVITSIDHDPHFARVAAEGLGQVAGPVTVKFVLAPLVLRVVGGKLLPVYLPEPIGEAAKSPADLVLVDGPPAALGGREGTLHQALERSREGTVIVVDDAARASEREAIANWRAAVGDAIEIREPDGFSRGVAVAMVRAPHPARVVRRAG